ncbi:villidin, putative, partial [Entamoeba invadens IP1]
MKPFMTSPDYSKRPENPMLIAIREFCFKPKKLVKTQETQIVSSLSVKTPELTPTKGHPVKNELIRRKTERLSRRLTFELNEQQKRLTTHKKTELLPMKQYPIFNGITKNPSILRSSSRKFIAVATTEKSEFPSPPNKEELVGVSRQSHENLLKVTQELKTTNHQLKRITVVPTSSTLLLVTPIASEKNIILIEVPVSYKSLNSSIGAVLAEDTTKKLYVWRGKKTSLIMKGKCADYSVQYKLYHKVGYSIQIEDENEESVDFLNAIGGKFPFEPLTVNPQNDRLCYEEKTVTMIPCGSGELKKTALTGLHSFLVRTGFNTFLWCGSKTSKNAREACAKIASTHQVGKLYVIFQGHEPFIFQALFVDWIIPKTSTKLPPAPSVKKDR